jgi:hypothetical protein
MSETEDDELRVPVGWDSRWQERKSRKYRRERCVGGMSESIGRWRSIGPNCQNFRPTTRLIPPHEPAQEGWRLEH